MGTANGRAPSLRSTRQTLDGRHDVDGAAQEVYPALTRAPSTSRRHRPDFVDLECCCGRCHDGLVALRIVVMIRHVYDGSMRVRGWIDDGTCSDWFDENEGFRRGCNVVQLLFSLFFSAMIVVATDNLAHLVASLPHSPSWSPTRMCVVRSTRIERVFPHTGLMKCPRMYVVYFSSYYHFFHKITRSQGPSVSLDYIPLWAFLCAELMTTV